MDKWAILLLIALCAAPFVYEAIRNIPTWRENRRRGRDHTVMNVMVRGDLGLFSRPGTFINADPGNVTIRTKVSPAGKRWKWELDAYVDVDKAPEIYRYGFARTADWAQEDVREACCILRADLMAHLEEQRALRAATEERLFTLDEVECS